ncbi:MAG: diguanylate cyclase [Eubacterium sp.]|nr:diguanylate cyclase [Eubacterium sp.]
MGDIEGIEELECRMRYRLIFVMGILVITCTVVDAGFFIYYLAGDMIDTPVPVYIIKRLLIPFVVSVASYIAARIYNRSDNSVERKNRICAIALATIAGIMAMCHSYFTPIWCAPAAAMIVGMTFHNKRLGRGLLYYGIVFIVAAACWVMTEHPEELHYYMQTLFVVLVMHGLFYCVGVVVQGHNLRVVECTRQMALTGQQYREQLQYDALTGVFSRRHLMERALEHMSRCGADDPVSVAIIDIDNFKSVNDTYGHEN